MTNLENQAWSNIALSNDGTKMLMSTVSSLYVSNTAFSSSDYYANFKPFNLPSSTTVDGTTLNYIVKY
uniref:Uncharacterized protein n=1 Tax=viral metagenome TaxID=1070528 RepID=A0A6C0JMZ6_9ZZZZ